MSVNTMKDGSYCVCLLVSKLGKALTGIGTKGDRIISSLRILGTNVVSIAGLFLTTYTMKEEKISLGVHIFDKYNLQGRQCLHSACYDDAVQKSTSRTVGSH